MYFKRAPATNILRVSDFYATLLNIQPDGGYEFDVSFTITSIASARSLNCQRVVVSAYSGFIHRESIINDDRSSLAERIQKQLTRAKIEKQQQDDLLLARSSISLQLSVPSANSIVLTAAAQNPFSGSGQAISSVSSVHAVNDRSSRMSLDDELFVGSAFGDVSQFSVGATARENFHGIFNSNVADDQMQIFSSVSSAVLQPSASSPPAALAAALADGNAITLHETIVLPSSSSSNVQLRFELYDDAGNVVQMIDRTLDIAQHAQLFHVPTTVPTVTTTFNSTKAFVEIRSNDSYTKFIDVFRRTVIADNTLPLKYEFVTRLALGSDGSAKLPCQAPLMEAYLYRCIPVSMMGVRGSIFGAVALLPTRKIRQAGAAVSMLALPEGVRIDVSDLPSSAASVQVCVRNVTLRETNFKLIGAPTLVINPDKNVVALSIVDVDVIDGWTYEYAARVVHRDGINSTFGNQLLSYTKPTAGKVSIDVSNVSVSLSGTLNVTFDLSSKIIDNDLDVARSLMQNSEVLQYFNNDVAQEREFFNNLITHSVERVDVTTGQRDDFGIIVDGAFDDVLIGSRRAIPALQSGHRYRYDVSVLLRSPDTLLDGLQREVVDPTTKKPYTFNPAKFLHPLVARTGTLVSSKGAQVLFGQDQMYYGSIGVLKSIDVSFDTGKPVINNASASRFNSFLVSIDWSMQGDVTDVDYFVIIKDADGVRELVGRVHLQFSNNSFRFIHVLSRSDVGNVTYAILPVLYNNELGTPAATNSILVEGM